MRSTLRRRFILSHTLTFFVIVPLMGLALIYVLESRVLLPDISRELKEQALLVVQLTKDHPDLWSDPDQAQALADRTGKDVSATVMFLDRGGHILGSSDPLDAASRGQQFYHSGLRTILAGQMNEHTDYSPRMDSLVADVFIPVTGPDNQMVGVVRMVHRLSTVFEQFSRLRYFVVAILGLALILGTLAGYILAINLERPLQEVTQGINRLASGHELAALPERGPEEIRLVLHAFNVLMERLRSLQESRRQLLANMVHELSTPLGALKSGVQALQDGADEEPELRGEMLRGMNEEIRRLTLLLEDLTGLHDQVLGQITLRRQGVAMSEWVSGVLAVWRGAAIDKGLHWQTDLSPALPTLQVDPDRLAQVLGNLLNNAIKYTANGGTITVSAGVEKNEFHISVADTGSGIPPDELTKIFTPFYRGRHSGRFPEGMGLGLAIARELTEAHRGRLVVESKLGKGSCFSIWLPA
jgi:two-component system sensor histidine kinase BaeS